MWLYTANRPHLLFEPISSRTKRVGAYLALGLATLYTLAIAISDTSPGASLAIYTAVPVLYFIGLFVERSTAPPGTEDDDFT